MIIYKFGYGRREYWKHPPEYSLSFIARRLKGKKSRILRKEFPHLREWCGEHMWAPSCFHGSVGNGWDVVSKYIETQDVHHAKNAGYRPRT
jgi:putative transposase